MENPKKEWSSPELQILGDMATLTKQGRQKGLGTGDCLQNSQANQNTGPCGTGGGSDSGL